VQAVYKCPASRGGSLRQHSLLVLHTFSTYISIGLYNTRERAVPCVVTGQLADTPTRGLDDSRTGHLADWTTRGCHWRLCVLSFRSFGGICETASCPVRELAVRELAYPRVVQCRRALPCVALAAGSGGNAAFFSRQPQLGTGGFHCSKALPPACPC